MLTTLILTVLAVVFVFSVSDISDADPESANRTLLDEGVCGPDLVWKYYSDLSLEITGSRTMNDYADSDQAPWSSYTVSSVSITGARNIGSYAFYQMHMTLPPVIDSTVIEIGNFAFAENDFVSLELPGSIDRIGDGAFYKCVLLESAVIESGSIGQLAFAEDAELAYVTLGSYVYEIGSYAFYSSGIESIDIPAPVRSIPVATFANCTSLTTVSIGRGVTSIASGTSNTEPGAFYNCTSLTTVTFSAYSALTRIGDPTVGYLMNGVFANCSSLETCVIPDSVKIIGGSAFYNCRSLTSCHMPDSLEIIGIAAYWNCSSLAGELVFSDSVETIGINAFFMDDGNVDTGITKVVIGAGVVSIPYGAFVNLAGLKEVVIGPNVKDIGSTEVIRGVFAGCVSLEKVTLPAGLKNISNSAFYNCPKLAEIEIPSSVVTIGTQAFYGCSSLPSVTLPSGLTSIGTWAFGYTTGMKQALTIPDSVKTIGNYAFYNSGIISVVTGHGLTALAEGTFAYCKSMTYAFVSNTIVTTAQVRGNANYGAFSSNDLLEKVVFEENSAMKSFGGPQVGNDYFINGTFAYCPNLVEINLPDSLTSIGWPTFYNDAKLRTLTAQKDGEGNYINAGAFPASLATISSYSFYGTRALAADIVFPDSSTYADIYVFYNSGITSVDLGNGVKRVYQSSFAFCTSLTTVTIGKSVTTIDSNASYNGAFCGCTALETVIFAPGSTLTTLGNTGSTVIGTANGGAFSGCTSLANIVLPDTLTALGSAVFRGCTSLPSDFRIPLTVKTVYNNTFALSSVTEPRLGFATTVGASAFPSGYKPVRYATAGDGIIVSFIPTSPSNTVVGTIEVFGTGAMTDYTVSSLPAWEGNTSGSRTYTITSVTLSDGITHIGAYSFYGSKGLTSIDIGADVETIGDSAFAGCPDLLAINIAAGDPSYASTQGVLVNSDRTTLLV
jgi:hypothetical protein